MPAHRKYYHIIHRIHDQWCRDNGYKPQASSLRPKVPSYKLNEEAKAIKKYIKQNGAI